MTDFLETLAAAGAQAPASLKEVTALAERQVMLEGEVDKAEAALKEAKKRLNKVQLDELPSAMQAAGMSEFVLADGRKVTLKEELTASVPKSRKEEIIAKLRTPEMSADDLVSRVFSADLGRGEATHNAVAALEEAAEKVGLLPLVTEDVNTARLKALLASRMKEGKNDDLSFFGAFVVKKTVIKETNAK